LRAGVLFNGLFRRLIVLQRSMQSITFQGEAAGRNAAANMGAET